MAEYHIILNKFAPFKEGYVYTPKGMFRIPPVYVPIGFELQPGVNTNYNIEGFEKWDYINNQNAQVFSSQFLGLAVFSDVILQNTTDQSFFQMLQVLITVNQTKNIVKTVVQGRNGTVKEMISLGDYQVSLEGGIYESNKFKYPMDDVRKLERLLATPEALKVISPFLNEIFEVHYLVVENYDFPQEKGKQNVQTFSIKSISDDPPEMNISNNG